MSETIIFYTAFYVFSILSIGMLMTIREFYRLSHADPQPANRSRHTERTAREVTHALVPGYSGA